MESCESCHGKRTVLADKEIKPVSFSRTGFLNKDSLKRLGYVVGAHRVPALDILLILLVIAPVGLPIVHGGFGTSPAANTS